MKRLAFTLIALLVVPFPGARHSIAEESFHRQKKLIATGWEHADTKRLRENLTEMEKQPFHGIVVDVVGEKDATQQQRMRVAFSNQAWQPQWFDAPLKDLQACKFTRFTDNFLIIGANPGDVDYFDDAGWTAVVEHWRIAAHLARQAGFKGLLFDPEHYTPPFAQFSWKAQPQWNQHSFNDYSTKAKQRGREVMEAVAAEYPEITLFSYFLNSINAHIAGQSSQQRLLSRSTYGLLPAFLDGWLDVAPPTVTIVDGCESAYLYNSVDEYLESANLMRGNCQELISPVNRARYRAQVQTSFGVYLDAYVNPATSIYYIDPKGGTSSLRLRENVRTALRVADEYVWIYGEKYRWFPTDRRGVNPETWPEVLPKADQILAFATDPVAFARSVIAKQHPENLVRNGDFSNEQIQSEEGHLITWREKQSPAGWNSWQAEKSHGVFSWDRENGCLAKGSAQASGVVDGCFLQSWPAEAGESYAVAARVRNQGLGSAYLRVRWQTADRKWTAEVRDQIFVAAESDSSTGEWQEILGVVEVPKSAQRLTLLLGVNDQLTSEDRVWFDDVQVFRLE